MFVFNKLFWPVLGISLPHPAVVVETFSGNVSIDCFAIYLYRLLILGFPEKNSPNLSRVKKMGGFLQTIRFKIVLALGLCVALMATIGLFGIGGLSNLNSNMSETYSEAMLPIAYLAYLANVRGAEFSLRSKLRALAMTHTSESAAKILPELDEDMAIINKVWPDYYPAKVSSEKERAVADKIAHDGTAGRSRHTSADAQSPAADKSKL